MYKLILVDDEAEIRQGLKEVVPFEEYGFVVAGEATNGVEALQLLEQTEPDLIITDIRMPLMDGLTLCRKARAILPTVRCIILSGYDDFEYARQAIDVQTLRYLLKPITSEEFKEVLQKTRLTLDEDFARRADVERLSQHFRESLPMLREALLDSLLSDAQTPDGVVKRAEKYGLALRSPFYTLALFRAGDNLPGAGIQDEELRLFTMRGIVAESLQASGREEGDAPEVFAYCGMTAALFLLRDDAETRYARLVERLEEARKTVRHYLSCKLYVGVGDVCAALSRLPACGRQALTALNQCALSGEEQVLCMTDIRKRGRDTLAIDDGLLGALNNSVKARDEAGARKALNALMDAAQRERPSPRSWKAYLMEIMMCFLRVVSEQALSWEGMDDQLDGLSSHILRDCPGARDAAIELNALLSSVMNAMESHRQSSGRQITAEAERYLKAHYAREDTSLEQLCLHLHVSPSYFSMIFKKETKKTFHQYLTDLRMDRALSLLSAGDMKISGIAQSVGLPDPSYFSYCFKKHFGYPPSKTRSR